MSMRITNLMTARHTLSDINDSLARVSKAQSKISSGKEILRPSDDPYGATRALALRADLEGLQQFQSSVGDGTALLNTADTALNEISSALQRVRELLVAAGNDSAGPAARAATADEVDQLIESIKQEANVRYGNDYVFSGTATSTPPYALGGADTYAGDAGTVTREIGPGVLIGINTDIAGLLGNGQGAADDKLLHTLRDISQHLRGGTPADANALRGTDLARLDVNFDVLNGVRADVGARTNRLAIAGSRLTSIELNSTQLLSDTEDADVAKTMIEYSTQQAAYNAALRVGANVVQNSLLDFLH